MRSRERARKKWKARRGGARERKVPRDRLNVREFRIYGPVNDELSRVLYL